MPQYGSVPAPFFLRPHTLDLSATLDTSTLSGLAKDYVYLQNNFPGDAKGYRIHMQRMLLERLHNMPGPKPDLTDRAISAVRTIGRWGSGAINRIRGLGSNVRRQALQIIKPEWVRTPTQMASAPQPAPPGPGGLGTVQSAAPPPPVATPPGAPGASAPTGMQQPSGGLSSLAEGAGTYALVAGLGNLAIHTAGALSEAYHSDDASAVLWQHAEQIRDALPTALLTTGAVVTAVVAVPAVAPAVTIGGAVLAGGALVYNTLDQSAQLAREMGGLRYAEYEQDRNQTREQQSTATVEQNREALLAELRGNSGRLRQLRAEISGLDGEIRALEAQVCGEGGASKNPAAEAERLTGEMEGLASSEGFTQALARVESVALTADGHAAEAEDIKATVDSSRRGILERIQVINGKHERYKAALTEARALRRTVISSANRQRQFFADIKAELQAIAEEARAELPADGVLADTIGAAQQSLQSIDVDTMVGGVDTEADSLAGDLAEKVATARSRQASASALAAEGRTAAERARHCWDSRVPATEEEPQAGAECRRDRDCAIGYLCVSGQCVRDRSYDEPTAPPGRTTRTESPPRDPLGARCYTSADCDRGLACVRGDCVRLPPRGQGERCVPAR